ncbi:hypothetical protein M9435_001168 [Picochlorum sp. BPE23]|nr:hypothetical protein M9435_001168 [Picochlorum sp. BPE23]
MQAFSVKAVCGSHGGIGVRVPHGRVLLHPRMKHQHAGHTAVQAQSSGDEGASPQDERKDASALVPSKPNSPLGEMAAYYLEMQPHLFQTTVENAFEQLKEESESATGAEPSSDSVDLVLSRRIQEVKEAEAAMAIEDLMYICILDKFRQIGVNMMANLGPIHEDMDTLRALTEGVHTKEAIEMVKEHMLGALGPASMAYGDTVIKMSKLQSAQVYAASIMFGYFLRRVDSRYQLSKQVGVLPESKEDAVARLERLFASVEDEDVEGSSNDQSTEESKSSEKGALRRYVESFDEEAMMATARLVTREGAALVERQTEALFGDAKKLQAEMQEAVGLDAASMEELMQRVQEAVASDKVESVTMTVATQRRAVLEAVAYGCFLRDIETWVDTDYGLLNPAK